MPRLQSCSLFPYSLNDNGEVVLFMRNKKESKNPQSYTGFGTSIKECDPNIFYSAARSYIIKTFGLCVPSELETLNNQQEIEKRIKEFSFKNESDIFTSPKCREVLVPFVENKFHMIKEVIGESHLALFLPMPYFRLETLNKALAESDKHSDLTFHWISL